MAEPADLPPLADHANRVDHALSVDAQAEAGQPGLQRLDDAAVEQRLADVEDMLGRLEKVPGRTAELALDVVETLMEIYGEAFARVVAVASDAPGVLTALTGDELVRHLLLLHRVHPDRVEERVARAVADAAPVLRSQSASAEVRAVDGGVALVQLSSGSCGHCGSADAVQTQLEEEVLAAAPELAGVRFVDPPRTPAVIPVEALLRRPGADGSRRASASPTRTPG
jgi:Fe-S cluster biogenesis protein NfuA